MNLFIVESPFQVLCCWEAIRFFEISNTKSILVLKYSKNLKSNEQMRKLGKKFGFKVIKTLPFRYAISLNDTLLMFYIWLWKVKGSKFNYLFMGEVKNSITRIATTNLLYSNYYFLDDGISTLEIQHRLNLGMSINSQEYSNPIIRKFNVALMKMLNLKHAEGVIVNWFTCFLLDKSPVQKVVQHNFAVIKDYLSQSSDTGKVFFIGSPISEDGKIHQSDEVESIRKAICYLQTKGSVIYCIHRRESPEKIEQIKKFSHISFRESEYPLEIDLLMKGENHFTIASFLSTALHTLPLIYDICDTEMFVLDEQKIFNSFKYVYKNILIRNKSNPSINIIADY